MAEKKGFVNSFLRPPKLGLTFSFVRLPSYKKTPNTHPMGDLGSLTAKSICRRRTLDAYEFLFAGFGGLPELSEAAMTYGWDDM